MILHIFWALGYVFYLAAIAVISHPHLCEKRD